MKSLLVPGLLVLTGCAAPVHALRTPGGCHADFELKVHGDPAFNWFQRRDIEAAAEEWELAVGVRIRVRWDLDLDTVREQDITIVPVKAIYPQTLAVDEAIKGTTLGWLKDDHISIVTDRQPNEGEFYAVVLHEFGHLLGCPHTATGIMRPHRDYAVLHLTDADVADFPGCR